MDKPNASELQEIEKATTAIRELAERVQSFASHIADVVMPTLVAICDALVPVLEEIHRVYVEMQRTTLQGRLLRLHIPFGAATWISERWPEAWLPSPDLNQEDEAPEETDT